ncbi:MAG: hypothetical protein IGS48_11290 [Oscillatoriales cyanobacterium C42_A2020_001]|nr:hypothetical protein [Leptolyngbyaceae cyanobacterium C42_A2020_001]
MANQEWETDEDKMIHHYQIHRDLIGWLIGILEKEGVSCQRTIGNDANGDIFYPNLEDEPRVKQIIREINIRYNS